MSTNANQDNLHSDSHSKSVYTAPKISQLGSIAELTQGMVNGNYNDSMAMMVAR